MVAYLLASLPTPRLGERPSITPQEFLEHCRGFVSEARWLDLATSLGLVTGSYGAGDEPAAAAPARSPAHERVEPVSAAEPRDDATRAWTDLAAQVDDAVMRARAARTQRDAAGVLRNPSGHRVDVAEAVTQAFALPHPGAREHALLELRWRLADELGRSEPDGFAALLGRAAQLRLAWRWSTWDDEAGRAALEAVLRRVEDRRG
jgi:hypothetical protein